MNRRELMLVLGGAITAASPLHAQQKAMPVIGYLNTSSSGPPLVAAFKQGLSETGYVEGHNVAIEYYSADGHYDRLPALAADLVARKVDVIVTFGPGVAAAKSATSTIPIVFTNSDPVGQGLVASLARPGGNLTGVSLLTVEMMPKPIELISEFVPRASLIALLVNPDNSTTGSVMKDVQEAAHKRGAAPYLESQHRRRDQCRVCGPR